MSYDQLLKEEDLSEEQDESAPIRPSRRRCNRGTSATELERPRSFTGLPEYPRYTRMQHRGGHNGVSSLHFQGFTEYPLSQTWALYGPRAASGPLAVCDRPA
ncbi:unnamed protein product [Pleuronectes platessa]|uniref:Uncharacterized protein n=1 Tax=Pleuronectes platessa TaxID=8262 RepID=A0A9N7YBY9_PLEPL|nr:unnamed protein product [Pleuronectes platessa]